MHEYTGGLLRLRNEFFAQLLHSFRLFTAQLVKYWGDNTVMQRVVDLDENLLEPYLAYIDHLENVSPNFGDIITEIVEDVPCGIQIAVGNLNGHVWNGARVNMADTSVVGRSFDSREARVEAFNAIVANKRKRAPGDPGEEQGPPKLVRGSTT